MPATAAIPALCRRAAYENWRPPLIGVQLLVPIGVDCLLVAETLGSIVLPVDTVHTGERPWQAAQHVLRGARHGIPVLRHVVLDQKQMRRRKVITHVLATASMSRSDVAALTYRDPRGELRVLPTDLVINRLPTLARPRVLFALQALAIDETVYLEDGVVQDSPPAEASIPPCAGACTHDDAGDCDLANTEACNPAY
ncbi:hypothetical protein [Streptomyces sp. 4N124]|uniref:hypothetical protein n=1 Tax=Streptomyces sp. 4N124 TaxID=3457420 RepID=UPI003FD15E29